MRSASRYVSADHPTIVEIRNLYEGRGLGVADLQRMSGEAIAAAFDVHPHSIDAWVKRWKWRRPAWFRRNRPYGVKPSERSQEALRVELLALVRAAIGEPCPSNVMLARALRISGGTIVSQLRRAVAAGDLASESRGPYRRLTLRDGTATCWTEKINGHETALKLGISWGNERHRDERPSVASVILAAVRGAADRGERCPTNAVLAQAARCTKGTARRALARLAGAGSFTIERRLSTGGRADRRILFADGRATSWASGVIVRGMIDYAVQDALRALRRQGIVVFDIAVHTGQGWGIAWSVDGKVTGRSELLELSARRTARAIEQLQAGAHAQ